MHPGAGEAGHTDALLQRGGRYNNKTLLAEKGRMWRLPGHGCGEKRGPSSDGVNCGTTLNGMVAAASHLPLERGRK